MFLEALRRTIDIRDDMEHVQLHERTSLLIEVCRALCNALGVDPDVLWSTDDPVSRSEWRWAVPHLSDTLGDDPRVLALEVLRRATDIREPEGIGSVGSRAVQLIFVLNALSGALELSTAGLWEMPFN